MLKPLALKYVLFVHFKPFQYVYIHINIHCIFLMEYNLQLIYCTLDIN